MSKEQPQKKQVTESQSERPQKFSLSEQLGGSRDGREIAAEPKKPQNTDNQTSATGKRRI